MEVSRVVFLATSIAGLHIASMDDAPCFVVGEVRLYTLAWTPKPSKQARHIALLCKCLRAFKQYVFALPGCPWAVYFKVARELLATLLLVY